MPLQKWINTANSKTTCATCFTFQNQVIDRCREDIAFSLLLDAIDRIVKGGVWFFSPETRAAEELLNQEYFRFVFENNDSVGLQHALERWREIGTRKKP